MEKRFEHTRQEEEGMQFSVEHYLTKMKRHKAFGGVSEDFKLHEKRSTEIRPLRKFKG
jgi:hypothetical protein